MGSPLDLYNNPANRFVASFIGSPAMNFLPAGLHSGGVVSLNGGATITLPASRDIVGEQRGELGVRPEHVHLTSPDAGLFNGVVSVVEQLGNTSYVYLETALGPVISEADQGVVLHPGDKVGITLDAARAHRFDATGNALR